MRKAAASLALALTVSLLGASRGVAQAGSAPEFDTDRYCEQMVQLFDGAEEVRVACMRQEYIAMEEVKEMAVVDEEVKKQCTEFSTFIGGSYQIYQTCLWDELGDSAELEAPAPP